MESGELLALLGRPAAGKTTLLRIIAGLETADAGQVLFHGGTPPSGRCPSAKWVLCFSTTRCFAT